MRIRKIHQKVNKIKNKLFKILKIKLISSNKKINIKMNNCNNKKAIINKKMSKIINYKNNYKNKKLNQKIR